MSGQQGVNRALYQLAGRSLADSQYAMAIQCLLAVLENDPDPDDFAQCSLDLARIYIDYTEDTHKAQEKLLQLVRYTACGSDSACCFVLESMYSHSEMLAACPHQRSLTQARPEVLMLLAAG